MVAKPIETYFDGYHFRSRLEARWAVFFKTLGIPYEYEKEGYDLGPAGLYLPDFWLPSISLRTCTSASPGLWVEIKPVEPDWTLTGDDNHRKWQDTVPQKCRALADATGSPVLLAVGLPGPRDGIDDSHFEFSVPWGFDNCMNFMQCHNPKCSAIKVEFREGHYMHCDACGAPCDEESPQLSFAYLASRSARFEYGQSGPTPTLHPRPTPLSPETQVLNALYALGGSASLNDLANILSAPKPYVMRVLARLVAFMKVTTEKRGTGMVRLYRIATP